ncbi:hypothetical protein AR540_21255 [Pseudomonas sp. EpS/L25]|nr:hypothetical protein AR540_21255 [Pseudomonas sp. EpS/L25]
MPGCAVLEDDFDVDGDLAEVMEDAVGDRCRPGFGLGGLLLGWRNDGEEVVLPDLQGLDDDL